MGLNDIMARLKSSATDINVVSKKPKRDKEIEQELRASLLYLGFKAEDICHWLIDTDALLMRVMMTNKNKFKMIIKYKSGERVMVSDIDSLQRLFNLMNYFI